MSKTYRARSFAMRVTTLDTSGSENEPIVYDVLGVTCGCSVAQAPRPINRASTGPIQDLGTRRGLSNFCN